MSTYAIQADFEDIDSPELIAATISILQADHWNISKYNANSVLATKENTEKKHLEFKFIINKQVVNIECSSDSAEDLNQSMVEAFIQNLHQFISSPAFDNQIRNLKNHYFMNIPLQKTEEESTQKSNYPLLNTLFSLRKNLWVTPVLIFLNVLVFIVMGVFGISIFDPKSSELLIWGANFRSNFLQGEWWRLISACFLHAGIIHILLNMWGLFNIGFFLERLIGSWRFLFAYLISGIASSLNSIAWHMATPSVGASGAIFGVFGLFLALLTTNLLEKGFRNAMLKSMVPLLFINLIIGTSDMIDNAGHIGGLIAGLICGYLIAWHYKNPKNKLINSLSVLIPIILILISSVLAYTKLPDTYGNYEKILTDTDKLVYIASITEKNSPTDTVVNSKLWDNAISELHKVKNLELNEPMIYHYDAVLFYLQQRKLRSKLLADPYKNQALLKKYTNTCDSMTKTFSE